MSILIGVNDVWHALGNGDTIRPHRYEQLLTMLVEDSLDVFPDLKIAILEPFVLKGTATEGNWEAFDSNVRALAKIAKQVAERYGLVFVPLQEKFDTQVTIRVEAGKALEGKALFEAMENIRSSAIASMASKRAFPSKFWPASTWISTCTQKL